MSAALARLGLDLEVAEPTTQKSAPRLADFVTNLSELNLMALAHVEFDATSEAGALLSNVEARVELEGGGLVSIYSDRAGSTPLANPETFADGKIDFYVAGGAYKITLTSGASSRVLRLKANGLLAEKDAVTAAAVSFTPAAGLSSTNVQAAIEEAATSGGAISVVVVDRTALKAIDTTWITEALLTEAGREGLFVWKSGNYAALITADTLEHARQSDGHSFIGWFFGSCV